MKKTQMNSIKYANFDKIIKMWYNVLRVEHYASQTHY